VNSKVTAQFCAFTSTLSHANLANNYVAGASFLTTIQLNTKALTWGVAEVFGGTASFDV
jgi:hypothetical protein